MKNKEKFLAIVSQETNNSSELNRERIKNRAMLRESQQIAMKVLSKLDEFGWSQKDLADKMCVSPQYVSKILKGKENLTIETQVVLQQILDIPVLASYYENKRFQVNVVNAVSYVQHHSHSVKTERVQTTGRYETAKIIALKYHAPTGNYSYKEVA